MSNKLQIKRTTVSGRTPNTTNSANSQYIDTGELAINVLDGRLFSSDGTNLLEFGIGTPVYDEAGNLISNTFVTTRTAALAAVTLDVVPTTDNTYSLGSTTKQWRHLYVSSNTIYIGNTPVSISAGTLLVNNNPVNGTYAEVNANGSTQNTATAVTASVVKVLYGSSGGIRLPVAANGVSVRVRNNAVTINVYPPANQEIVGSSGQNLPVTQSPYTTREYQFFGDYWFVMVLQS